MRRGRAAGDPAPADARREREKLIAAATEAFATAGVGTSLEDIARRAGVGIGTLYRHFPTRDASTKRSMGEALQAPWPRTPTSTPRGTPRSPARWTSSWAPPSPAGAVRGDARGDEVLRALGALWMIREGDDREAVAARTLDLIVDGLRFGAPGTPGTPPRS